MKKTALTINLVLFLFLLFSCKKENASSNQLSESEAYYKSKIASFLTLTENLAPDKKGATVVKVSFKSYQEAYEYFKFLDPISSDNRKVTTATSVTPSIVPIQWYGYNPIYPPSNTYVTYDGNVTFNSKIVSSANPGNIGVTAHLRFTFLYADIGVQPRLIYNQILGAAGIFFGGLGTVTSVNVLVTPGGPGGTISGMVQYVFTVAGSSLSGYVTVQGNFTYVAPTVPNTPTCLIN